MKAKKSKQKVKKSVLRRFRVTKNGKVIFGHQYSSHLKLHKSKKRIRRQKQTGKLEGKFGKKIKRMLGKA